MSIKILRIKRWAVNTYYTAICSILWLYRMARTICLVNYLLLTIH